VDGGPRPILRLSWTATAVWAINMDTNAEFVAFANAVFGSPAVSTFIDAV